MIINETTCLNFSKELLASSVVKFLPVTTRAAMPMHVERNLAIGLSGKVTCYHHDGRSFLNKLIRNDIYLNSKVYFSNGKQQQKWNRCIDECLANSRRIESEAERVVACFDVGNASVGHIEQVY